MRFLVVALFTVGCAGDCESEQGTISGKIVGSGDVTAYLHDDDGELVAEVDADEDGAYEFVVEHGKYIVSGSQYEAGSGYVPPPCYSEDVPVNLGRCDDIVVDLNASECIQADKPNLYLYPTADTETKVTLHHDSRQVVFESAPPYAGGWTGTAHPDGTFTPTGGDTAPFLFYEITVLPAQMCTLPLTGAVCVPGDGAVQAMADLLGEYGFNERERADFVDGWVDDLPVRASYAVYPQRSVESVVRVEIQPPLPLERLWLVVTDGAGCVPSGADVAPIPRNGAHAVEWGVVLRGLR